MNVSGIVSKITANVDTIGLLYGFLADPMYAGRGLAGAPDFIIDRLEHWKPSALMKPKFLIDFYKGNPPYMDTAKTAVMLYLAGEGLKAIGQSKWGNIAQKFAEGAFKGSLIALAAFAPAANPHGATGSNFANAPAIGAYGY